MARGTARYGYGSRAHRGGYYFPRYRYYGYGYWGYPHPYYWSGWYYHYPSYTYVYGDAAYGDAPAVFETDIRPKRAELWVDGEPRGQARDFNGKWDLLYLEPGAHTLEFRHPGHRTLKLDAHVRAGMYYRLDERLAEGEGTEERSLGRPVPGEEPAPSASGADYRVEPPADHRRPAPGLRAGLLRIHALPSDAAVYLDGEFLGHAEELARLHGAIPVAEGRHVVEVVRPGYEPQRQEIVVEGREPVRLDIELARRR